MDSCAFALCRPKKLLRCHKGNVCLQPLLTLPAYLCLTPVLFLAQSVFSTFVAHCCVCFMTSTGALLWKIEQKTNKAFACGKVTIKGKRHWYEALPQAVFVALSDDTAWIIRTNGDLYLQTGTEINCCPSLFVCENQKNVVLLSDPELIKPLYEFRLKLFFVQAESSFSLRLGISCGMLQQKLQKHCSCYWNSRPGLRCASQRDQKDWPCLKL